MPELPEVETIKRTLEERIVGKRIKCIQVLLEKMVLPLNVEQFKIRVEGSIITGLGRRVSTCWCICHLPLCLLSACA